MIGDPTDADPAALLDGLLARLVQLLDAQRAAFRMGDAGLLEALSAEAAAVAAELAAAPRRGPLDPRLARRAAELEAGLAELTAGVAVARDETLRELVALATPDEASAPVYPGDRPRFSRPALLDRTG